MSEDVKDKYDPYEETTGVKRLSRGEFQDLVDEERRKRADIVVADTSERTSPPPEITEIIEEDFEQSTEKVVHESLGIEVLELLSKVDQQLTRLEKIISIDSVENTIEASNIARVAKKLLKADEIVLAEHTKETLLKIVEIYDKKHASDLKELSNKQKRRDGFVYKP